MYKIIYTLFCLTILISTSIADENYVSLKKSKVNKIIIVLGYQNKEVKKVIRKKKKFIFVTNKNYKKGMASSIKTGLKKVSKQDKGFIIVQSDMPFIKTKDINKICSSIKKRKDLVHALKFRNRVGNPIGFDISVLNKFKKIKGHVGAKFMVKRLNKNTNFIKTTNIKANLFWSRNYESGWEIKMK